MTAFLIFIAGLDRFAEGLRLVTCCQEELQKDFQMIVLPVEGGSARFYADIEPGSITFSSYVFLESRDCNDRKRLL